MHITRARIRNYSGFRDSGDLHFSSGFNLVVGRNSTGKTLLLSALAQQIRGRPHRSTHTVEHAGLRPDQITRLSIEGTLSGAELRVLALMTTDELRIPVPAAYTESDANWAALLESVFDAPEITLRAEWYAQPEQVLSQEAEPTSARMGFESGRKPGESVRFGRFSVNDPRSGYKFRKPGDAGPGDDSYRQLAGELRRLVFRFEAERLRIGRGPSGPVRQLAPDASNLPEVLGNLQSDRHRSGRYLKLVQEVLPDVKDVSVVPVTPNEQEIRVSHLDPARERSDLAVPLSQCGSGVAQVLALLYVVVTEDLPRVILVDEPNSFLHPGASRALISILKRFPKHQYIISTHSPEVMAAVGPAPTTVLEWKNEQCNARQFKTEDESAANTALSVVGARLSDVFGYDNIIWCEGPSDAQSSEILLGAFFPSVTATAIVPVHTTGAFDRRRREETIDIYRQLSQASALVPPTLGFVFDHEGRTEEQRRELEKRTDATVRLLPVRMMENLLLSAPAVAALVRELEPGNAVTIEAVEEFLQAAMDRDEHFRDVPAERLNDRPNWVHAKNVINDAVAAFTENRHGYINTRDIAFLTNYMLATDPDRLIPAARVLGELLRLEPRLPDR